MTAIGENMDAVEEARQAIVDAHEATTRLTTLIGPVWHEREGRCAKLQRAVDQAHTALLSSQYVGGPSERDAWQTAVAALAEVCTQHLGDGRAVAEQVK